MKEKWLKDIQKQMADYQTKEPDGLWEDIQEKMSEKSKKHQQSVLFLWTKRFAAAAAVLAFVLTLNHYFSSEKELSNSVITNISEEVKDIDKKLPTSPTKSDKEDILTDEIVNPNTLESVASVKKRKVPTEQEAVDEFFISIKEDKTDNQPETKTRKDTWAVISQPKKHQEKIVSGEELLLEEVAEVDKQKTVRNRMSFGIFTSGGMGSSLSNKPEIASEFTAVNIEAAEEETMWKDSPLLGTLALSNGETMHTETKHRLPIRTGVLFAYKLSNRFALESGLTYTRLVSDLREGSEVYYFTSEQKLHFVGLPLNLKYQVFSWKGFELYSAVGMLAEKNVSGTLNKTHFFDGVMQQNENENIKIAPLQWSANASVGLQYNFSSLIGVYAEPSISYYFSNSTPIKTIYQDRPFNFHLNFGLRFSFGK
ncbi:MAG: outer membrane beta-barrel protein [Capnocytophaga felis]|nr:outer membrane beta-barrel protein [Capnocytophaga felis]